MNFNSNLKRDSNNEKYYVLSVTSLNEEEIEYENVNVGKMRRRFNELLDDALSMFGSKNGSPEGSDVEPVRQLDNRIHSAVIR